MPSIPQLTLVVALAQQVAHNEPGQGLIVHQQDVAVVRLQRPALLETTLSRPGVRHRRLEQRRPAHGCCRSGLGQEETGAAAALRGVLMAASLLQSC